jgi:hypothetical protein
LIFQHNKKKSIFNNVKEKNFVSLQAVSRMLASKEGGRAQQYRPTGLQDGDAPHTGRIVRGSGGAGRQMGKSQAHGESFVL